MNSLFIVLGAALVVPATSLAQESTADATALAKKLANPIASLISVPLQYNDDTGYGPSGDGDIERLNIQPVIPVSLDEQWNLIIRTIIPVVAQNDIPSSGQGDSELGDIVASQFFSPKAPTASGWTWSMQRSCSHSLSSYCRRRRHCR